MGHAETDTYCGNCGQAIYDEDSDNRRPCPHCGSTARKYSLTANITVSVSASATATKISFPQSLLNSAANLLARNDKLSLSMAVVFCHTACDIAADRAVEEALEKRSLGHTKAPLRAMFSGYSPKNGRIWDFYCALTGDDIKQRPFWQKVVDSSKCRDGIIHSGRFATAEQATEAHAAAVEFVKHLKQWD